MKNLLPGHYVEVTPVTGKVRGVTYLRADLCTKDLDGNVVTLRSRFVGEEPRIYEKSNGANYYNGWFKLAEKVTEKDIQDTGNVLTEEWLRHSLDKIGSKSGLDLVGTYPPKTLGGS